MVLLGIYPQLLGLEPVSEVEICNLFRKFTNKFKDFIPVIHISYANIRNKKMEARSTFSYTDPLKIYINIIYCGSGLC